jgi:hypothetical protein
MPRVNVWHIGNLLGELLSLDPVEYERVENLPNADTAAFREVFVKQILPAYRRLSPNGREMVRESLRYFLNVPSRTEVVADMFAEMQDVPFGGDDAHSVLQALWQALFPGQDYRIDDLGAYLEENNDATGNEIYAPEAGWP